VKLREQYGIFQFTSFFVISDSIEDAPELMPGEDITYTLKRRFVGSHWQTAKIKKVQDSPIPQLIAHFQTRRACLMI